MATDTSLIAFKAISNFTMALGDMFKDDQRPLALYCHLIKQTTLTHEKAIQNHINSFHNFCKQNRDCLVNKDEKQMVETKISYSKKVFIEMDKIFSLANQDTKNVIWEHLLTISALVDPAGQAKQVLEEQKKSGKSTEEVDFLTNIIGKVDQQVDPNGNSMEAISSIMQSGVFTELVQGMTSGLENGSLDLGNLMGTVQNLVSNANEQSDDQEGGAEAMNMINGMMSTMMKPRDEKPTGDDGKMFDLAGMMSAALSGQGGMPDLGKMMGGGIQDSKSVGNSIEDKLNAEVEKAKKDGTL